MKQRIGVLSLVLFLSACQSQVTPTPTLAYILPPAEGPTLAPTNTIPPEATTPPTPISTSVGEVRLEDDFSGEETCLRAFDSPDASAGVEDGAYLMRVPSPGQIIVASCESLVIGNFVMEADVTVLEAPPEDSDYYYGLAFRIGGTEYYGYILGSFYNYCAFYGIEAGFTYLTNSTDFEALCWVFQPEEARRDGTQHMKVIYQDGRMDLYLNGVLLAVVRDSKLLPGWVGFTVGTAQAGGLVVQFDNLRVISP